MPTSAATIASIFIPTHSQISSFPIVSSNTIKVSIKSRTQSKNINISCVAAATVTTADLSSLSEEEIEGMSKEGKRIRVKESVKVYHVMKAPNLDLNGKEGVIKQYVGVWKGKSISANLPYKVEFVIQVEGQEKPVKVLAHLKEDEFEYLD